jgi:16S rRNA (cytosine1402-N4)-methyltransferase
VERVGDAHVPVLLDAVLDGLAVHGDGRYLDGTFGRGGHAAAILEQLDASGRLLVIDRDPDAVAAARARFGSDPRVHAEQGNFADMQALATDAGLDGDFDGILLDLGVSSPQLDDPARGFSFMADGPLDMRMDTTRGPTAADWLNSATEDELARVIRRYGEERFARRVARAIVTARAEAPLTRTGRLAEVVAGAIPRREPGRHPATRAFQAIRIHLNRELESVALGLDAALELLATGGRLCVISFHSLEDRMVKRFIRDHSREDEVWRGLPAMPESARPALRPVGKARRADAAEVRANPRARSAVLRVAERLR